MIKKEVVKRLLKAVKHYLDTGELADKNWINSSCLEQQFLYATARVASVKGYKEVDLVRLTELIYG